MSLMRMKESLSDNDLVKSSLLYRELLAEHEEILRHKWLESERAGYDIGFDQAQVDWQIKHRKRWLKQQQEKRGEGAQNGTPAPSPSSSDRAH